jgi:hypothetical protein
MNTPTAILTAALLWPQSAKAEDTKPQFPAVPCIITIVVVGTGAVIVVGLTKLCKLLPPSPPPPSPPPPPPPCCTNTPPCTNCPPAATQTSTSLVNATSFTDEAVEALDISGYTFENLDPNGLPYKTIFTINMESSTNVVNWYTNLTVTGWKSDSYVICVFANQSGPFLTNAAALTQGRATVSCTLPPEPRQERQFFRLVK